MEGIFTLPYSEYEAINKLQKKLTKSNGNSFYIPTSRQQKGIDFILHNSKNNKFLRFQVKSSRSYVHTPKKLNSGKIKEIKYKYNFWFNNFIERYEDDNADYYILFGLYPVYQQGANIKSRATFWKSIILCLSEKEMIKILEKVKTKKEKNIDKFFGFGFNEEKKIFGTRGFEKEIDLSEYLLENKLDELKKQLEKQKCPHSTNQKEK